MLQKIPSKKNVTFLISCKKSKRALDTRENLVKAEEQKIVALKKEIVEKIDALKLLESQLSLQTGFRQNQTTSKG